MSSGLFNHELFLLLLSLFFPLLISIFCLRSKILCRRESKLPPSPPRLPLIGNLHQLGKVVHHSLRDLSKKYGPIMFLKLGQVPTLVISSPEIVGEIVKSNDVIFSSRPKTLVTDILFYEGNNIAFAPYGEYWRQARKICVVELLNLKKVQSFQFVREQEVGVLVDKVRKACPDGMVINLSQMLIEASNNITSRCILGQRYREEDGSVNKVGELSIKMVAQIMSFSFGDFFPFLRWIDVVSGLIGRLRSTAREFEVFHNHVIQEHKAASGSGLDAEDFVDVLLRIQRESMPDFELTQNQLKGIIQDMFSAGIETTSVSTEWIMAELVRNPAVMKKAQEEVRRVVAATKKETIDTDDINRMEYLKNVVKESMRLHPPGPLLIPRETTARTQIAGYEIPAKTRVLINAWAIQRDPSLWDDPEEFIPERFEKNQMDFSGQDFQLIPFGFGRRRCPGLAFGVFSIEYVVANLLYWFDWKLPEDRGSVEDMDMTEVYGITAHKKVPLHVVPIEFFP